MLLLGPADFDGFTPSNEACGTIDGTWLGPPTEVLVLQVTSAEESDLSRNARGAVGRSRNLEEWTGRDRLEESAYGCLERETLGGLGRGGYEESGRRLRERSRSGKV